MRHEVPTLRGNVLWFEFDSNYGCVRIGRCGDGKEDVCVAILEGPKAYVWASNMAVDTVTTLESSRRLLADEEAGEVAPDG